MSRFSLSSQPTSPPPAPTADVGSASPPSSITVMVFKDELASRSFQVPLAWISRIGWLLSFLWLALFLSVLWGIRAHHAARQGSPERVEELEQEVASLRSRPVVVPPVVIAPPPKVAPAPSVASPPAAVAAVTPPPAPSTAGAAAGPGGFQLFQSLPAGYHAPSADAPPIKIQSLTAQWQGHGALQVHFAIQYQLNDGGNQQGRIVILARGPETLLAYPDGALNLTGGNLIKPESGESFSVSRYREARATLGPVRSPAEIRQIEVLLIGSAQDILVHERLDVEPPPAKRARARPTPTETEADSAAEPTAAAPAATSSATPAGIASPAAKTPAPLTAPASPSPPFTSSSSSSPPVGHP